MLTSRNRGFTLIELLLVIAVIGVLLMVGLPSYSIWMQNLRIRGAAESVQGGLQLARATAIARNTQAILVFRPASLSYFVYTVPNPGTPPDDWQDPDIGPAGAVDMIRRHNQADDSASASVTTTPAGLHMITFSSLGQVVANPDASATPTMIDIASTASTDPAIRPLRIVINPGGSTKACDPSPTVPVDDPRHC
jgi:type IV fimbrial biogenesis protein FimT